jgi:hypothetical protein
MSAKKSNKTDIVDAHTSNWITSRAHFPVVQLSFGHNGTARKVSRVPILMVEMVYSILSLYRLPPTRLIY